jgi:hypothetical protein
LLGPLPVGPYVVARRSRADRGHQRRHRCGSGPVSDPIAQKRLYRLHGSFGLVHRRLVGDRYGLHQNRPHPACGVSDAAASGRAHQDHLPGVFRYDRADDAGDGAYGGSGGYLPALDGCLFPLSGGRQADPFRQGAVYRHGLRRRGGQHRHVARLGPRAGGRWILQGNGREGDLVRRDVLLHAPVGMGHGGPVVASLHGLLPAGAENHSGLAGACSGAALQAGSDEP